MAVGMIQVQYSSATTGHASSPLFSSLFENWPRNLLVIRHILVFNELASLIPYRPRSR